MPHRTGMLPTRRGLWGGVRCTRGKRGGARVLATELRGLWAVGLNGWRWYENGAQRGPDVSTVARSRRVASPR